MSPKRQSAFNKALREAQQEGTSQQSDKPDSQVSSHPDNQTSDNSTSGIISNSDSQISSNSDISMVEYQESRQSRLPESQSTRKQDKKMVSYLKEKKPERKAQIAYLPLDLIKWLKVQAAQEGREISEIVADALELYRKQQ